MRVISCYIEGFGSLKKKEYSFDQSLTSFCEENGSGKSTLAAFIKAMLYGMPSYKSNSKEFADRLHYYPFEGGKFGGSLVFEKEGDTYKIERVFDKKSEVYDSLTVYRNGEKYQGFKNKVIGESVFGIDKASFERTAFVTDASIEIASTSSINAKLNAFVQGESARTLDAADALLEKEEKRYQNARGAGEIRDLQDRIQGIKLDIVNREKIQSALPSKYAQLRRNEEELKGISDRLEKHHKQAVLLKDWEIYEEREGEISALKEKLSSLDQRYPNGMPEREELEVTLQALENDDKARTEAGVSKLSAEEEARLSEYRILFASGAPDTALLDAWDEKIRHASEVSSEISHIKQELLECENPSVENYFQRCTPTDDELTSTKALADDYRKVDFEWRNTPDILGVETGKNTIRAHSFKPLFWAAAIVMILGVAAIFWNTYLGIALLAVGAIGILTIAFFYLNQKVSMQTVVAQPNPEKKKLEDKRKNLEDQLAAFVVRFGFASGSGVLVDLANLQNALSVYYDLIEKRSFLEKKLSELGKALLTVESELEGELSGFGMRGGSFETCVRELRRKLEDFNSLSKRFEEENSRQAELLKKREAYGATIKAFCDRYGFTSLCREDLEAITQDKRDRSALVEKIKTEQVKNVMLRQEKDLTEKPIVEELDVETLTEKEKALRQLIAQQTGEIEDNERQVEGIGAFYSELKECNEKLNACMHRHKCLQAARAFLKEADTAIKERFVKPVRDEFLKNAALLEETLGEHIEMSPNDYSIRFVRGGEERSDRHLSSGQKSICAFAFRLALMVQMYPEEKPFVILDDPFVALDAEHFEKVSSLLKKISKEMQIVYFTCHESRRL